MIPAFDGRRNSSGSFRESGSEDSRFRLNHHEAVAPRCPWAVEFDLFGAVLLFSCGRRGKRKRLALPSEASRRLHPPTDSRDEPFIHAERKDALVSDREYYFISDLHIGGDGGLDVCEFEEELSLSFRHWSRKKGTSNCSSRAMLSACGS